MVRKGMLLVTDVASKNNGWLRAFEGERDDPRRLTTTSNISVKYSFVSYIVLERYDSPTSAWFNINACRASQMRHNSLMEPQAELKIVLVFAPSHGDLAGEMVWSMPKMISPLDELHAIDWLRAAVLEGYQRVHFHTCCVAASFKELGASARVLRHGDGLHGGDSVEQEGAISCGQVGPARFHARDRSTRRRMAFRDAAQPRRLYPCRTPPSPRSRTEEEGFVRVRSGWKQIN